jgi:hypothetical protein
MGNLFDDLRQKLEDGTPSGGISALDLATLPPHLRQLLRLLLREVEMSQAELARATAALPAQERLTPAELEEALDQLQRQSWLIRLDQGEVVTYRVNLRRHRGSQLDTSLWERLSARLSRRLPRG